MATCNPKDTPAACYVFIHTGPGERIGRVTRGRCGWMVTKLDRVAMTAAQARRLVDTLNAVQGVTPALAVDMLAAATLAAQPGGRVSA